MSKYITSKNEIPDATCYVTALDTYFSKGYRRRNKVILPCESLEEANLVVEYAKSREEMRYVSISENKPRLDNRTTDYALMARDTAHAWYPAIHWMPRVTMKYGSTDWNYCRAKTQEEAQALYEQEISMLQNKPASMTLVKCYVKNCDC